MYKDNGKLNVELLAEVGDIAHRLRNLDKKLALNLNDPRYQQAIQHYGLASPANRSTTIEANKSDNKCTDANPVTTTTSSSSSQKQNIAAQIAQDISEKISGSDILSSSSQQRRYSNKQLEDIILEFYEKHLIFHQNQEKERIAQSLNEKYDKTKPKSRIYQLTSGDSNNMNNLLTTKTHSKCSTSDNNDGNTVDNLTDTKFESINKQNELTATTTTTVAHPNSGKRNSIANQQMPEIQISSSDEQTKPRKSLTEQQHISKDTGIGLSEEKPHLFETTSSTGGTCGHYCSGWQTSICGNQLNDDDLRTLVMELKYKIEFTERMNWLCKYIT